MLKLFSVQSLLGNFVYIFNSLYIALCVLMCFKGMTLDLMLCFVVNAITFRFLRYRPICIPIFMSLLNHLFIFLYNDYRSMASKQSLLFHGIFNRKQHCSQVTPYYFKILFANAIFVQGLSNIAF